MSKKKYYIEVVASDGKSLEKVAINARAADKALRGVSKGANMTDHAMKGASKQSSNSTKNFSKMSETISSGLVPAYATLAAQLFAISAAYQFLKRAGDLTVLREGQLAYTASTGKAIRSLTNDIIDATDAQVTFTDAAQAAAIGLASGLNAEQLTEMGRAAKNASIVLGRDVTDSFNRLVKGITKSEPELLDELGIILRLESATEKYASTIGKTRGQLTAFERSQAVYAEVIGQAEEKYSAIIDIVDPAVNKFAQLGKSFDDIIMTIKSFVALVAGPFAEVLTQIPSLAIAGFGLLFKRVLSVVIPGINNMNEATSKFAANAQAKYAAATQSVDAYRASLVQVALADRNALKASAGGRAQNMIKGMSFKDGSSFQKLQAGQLDQLNARQLSGMKLTIDKYNGYFKNMTAQQKKEFKLALSEMVLATKKDTSKMSAEFTKLYSTVGTGATRMKVVWATTMSFMATAAQKVVMWTSKLLSLAGWLSLVVTLGMVIYNLVKTEETLSDSEKAVAELAEKVASLRKEYELFNQVQDALNDRSQRTLGFLEAFGQRIGTLTVFQSRSIFENLSEGAEGFRETIEAANRGLRETQEELNRVRSLSGRENQSFPGRESRLARLQGEAGISFADFMKGEGTAAQKDFIYYLEEQVETLENSNDHYARHSKVFGSYINSIKQFLATGSPELIDQILQQQSAVASLTATLAGLSRQQTDNQQNSQKIFQQFMPDTELDKVLVSLKTEYIDIASALSDLKDIGAEELATRSARLRTIEREMALFTRLNEEQRTHNKILERTKALETREGIGATSGQSAIISQEYQRLKLEQERSHLMEQQANIKEKLAQYGESDTSVEEYNLELNRLKLDTLNAQLEVLERQRDQVYQIQDGMSQAFETGLQGGLASLIKGDESSFKDAILTLAQTTVSSVADTLSKQITEAVMGNSPIQVAARQAQIISGSFLAAGGQVAGMISAAVMGTPVATGGGLPGGAATMVSGRAGGILNMLKSAASFIPGFADGGVVHKPTLAQIGEGKYSEAVVPLPDGKRIPVDLGAGAGQTNHVEVNITMSEGGNAQANTKSSGNNAAALGNAIAKAVQKELQNQKRSGGILSPYGTA